MEKICKICALYPGSHSFREIARQNDTVFLYTKPAEALSYDDTNGILTHYENLLKSLDSAKWVWVFDMKDFAVKHLLNLYLFYKLCILISQYNDSLQEICIINPNQYMSHLLSYVLPFLPSSTRKKIKKYQVAIGKEELLDFIKRISTENSGEQVSPS
jgi:hypothetical protein